MSETWVRSLGWEDLLEKGKATHSNMLAWRIWGCKELDMTEQFSLHMKQTIPLAFWLYHGLLVCVWMLCCFNLVQLFVTLLTVARLASLSMRFSRQEYWSGLPFPPSGDFLTWRLNQVSYVFCIAGRFVPPRKPMVSLYSPTSLSLQYFLLDSWSSLGDSLSYQISLVRSWALRVMERLNA